MENKPKFHPNPKLKLMDQVREVLRYHHYAYRTEQTYCQWILRFIRHFGGKTHPRLLGAKDVVEVQRLLAAIEGKNALMAKLLYGSGLRLMECIRLRVQDVDFGQNLIFVRGGKGGKDRTTIMPRNLRDDLLSQIEAVKSFHHRELEAGFGEVYIPEALVHNGQRYPQPAKPPRPHLTAAR